MCHSTYRKVFGRKLPSHGEMGDDNVPSHVLVNDQVSDGRVPLVLPGGAIFKSFDDSHVAALVAVAVGEEVCMQSVL